MRQFFFVEDALDFVDYDVKLTIHCQPIVNPIQTQAMFPTTLPLKPRPTSTTPLAMLKNQIKSENKQIPAFCVTINCGSQPGRKWVNASTVQCWDWGRGWGWCKANLSLTFGHTSLPMAGLLRENSLSDLAFWIILISTWRWKTTIMRIFPSLFRF